MMKIKKLLFVFVVAIAMVSCQDDNTSSEFRQAIIETEYGDIKVMLYNSTPNHRDNFVKLAEEGFYDGTLFHRTVPGNLIQGGDPDSKTAKKGQALGMGGPGYKLDPEIGAPHIYGTIAAARTPNLEKRSSGSQFYIIMGDPVSEQKLNMIEDRKNVQYNEKQRELYKEKGGQPGLDGDYTVFGEVLSGMDVVEKISQQETARVRRPVEDIPMKIRMIN